MDRRVATVPILWNNDDVPELTQPETPYERVLDAVAMVGYRGIELGSNFSKDTRTLEEALTARRLSLSAAYYAPDFTRAEDLDANLEAGVLLARRVQELGTRVLVVADPLRRQREPFAGSPGAEHRASKQDFERMVEGVQELARRVKALGMVCAFHNHAGTYVETAEEIEAFLGATDPELVRFCLDIGHATVGSADPVDLIRRHGKRLGHVHLKDVATETLRELRTRKYGFLQALRARLFCELGRGCVPVREVVEALNESGYQGWYTVEQDTTRFAPAESARISFAFLSGLLEGPRE